MFRILGGAEVRLHNEYVFLSLYEMSEPVYFCNSYLRRHLSIGLESRILHSRDITKLLLQAAVS